MRFTNSLQPAIVVKPANEVALFLVTDLENQTIIPNKIT